MSGWPTERRRSVTHPLSTLQPIWRAHSFKCHLIDWRRFQSLIPTIMVLPERGSSIKYIFHLGRWWTSVSSDRERDKENIMSVTDAFFKVQQHDWQSVLIQYNIFICHPVLSQSVEGRSRSQDAERKTASAKFYLAAVSRCVGASKLTASSKRLNTTHLRFWHCSQSRSLDDRSSMRETHIKTHTKSEPLLSAEGKKCCCNQSSYRSRILWC